MWPILITVWTPEEHLRRLKKVIVMVRFYLFLTDNEISVIKEHLVFWQALGPLSVTVK
jgi:hypothetical protein